MSKQRTPHLTAVQAILDTPKGLARPLAWSLKDGNKAPPSYEYYSAVNIETGEYMEGVAIRSGWRESPVPGIPPKYDFAIFYEIQHRIYAVDFHANTGHLNKKTHDGLLHSGKKIGIHHEHLWTSSGYGYAEPLDIGFVDKGIEAHWNYFCEKASIVENHAFTPPEYDLLTGQGRLI